MLLKLLQAQFSPEDAEDFWATVMVVLREAKHHTDAKPYIMAVMQEIYEKKSQFPQHLEQHIHAGLLEGLTLNQLFTDDTYMFARASRVIQEEILEISKSGEHARKSQEHVECKEEKESNTSDDTLGNYQSVVEWEKAILMNALEVMYSRYKLPWARASIDMVFRSATEQRMHFHPEQRRQIEIWANTMRARRDNNVSQSSTMGAGGFHLDLEQRFTSGEFLKVFNTRKK